MRAIASHVLALPLSGQTLRFALAVVLATTLVASVGCTTEEGTTPTCSQDVGQDGNTHDRDNGCNQFAVCSKPNVEDCCVDEMGKPLTGKDMCLCKYGYGVAITCGGEGTGGSGGSGSGGAGGGGAGGSGGAGGAAGAGGA